MKYKISEVDFLDGTPYHQGVEINLEGDDYMVDLFDFENENLYYINLKIQDYDKLPTVKHLNKLLWVKIIASLLNLEVIEDSTIRDESKDLYFVEMMRSLRLLMDLDVKTYNPYLMDFDKSKLKKEDNGSYTLNSQVCIESNNRTTYYFRDVLMLQNKEKNVLMADYPEDFTINIDNPLNEYQYIKLEPVSSDENELAYDKLDEFICPDSGYTGSIRDYMTFLLSDSSMKYISTVNAILNEDDSTMGMFTYNNPILELVEAKAVKLKKPSLLFKELINSEDISDIQYGLKRLGYTL